MTFERLNELKSILLNFDQEAHRQGDHLTPEQAAGSARFRQLRRDHRQVRVAWEAQVDRLLDAGHSPAEVFGFGPETESMPTEPEAELGG
jgi:hypothetical protein